MDGSARTPSLEELLGQDRWLQALARRLVRDAATADDLVQETWFRALRARGREDAPRDTDRPLADEEARPWLGRVLRNVWRERGRSEGARSRREARTARGEALPPASESVERIELEQRLAAIVLGLEEPFRSVVVWHYYEGRSADDIARELGEPAPRIRWRLMRARELLRERLDRDQTDWPVRFSVFFPFAEAGLPLAPLGSTGSIGAAGLGAFTMGAKWLSGFALGLFLVWAAIRLSEERRDPLEEPSAPPALQVASAVGGEAAVEPLPAAEPAVERVRLAPGTVEVSIPPPAESLARLGGIVRASESGVPLAGVEVVIFEDAGESPQASVTTNEAGTFLFVDQEPGGREVGLRLDGRIPRRIARVELVAGEERRLELELEPGFGIALEVVDGASGSPIPGARVQLIGGDAETVTWMSAASLRFFGLTGETDAAGIAALSGGAPGVYQLVVEAEGYATGLSEALLRADSQPLFVALERGGVVHGVVLHANGTPAEGARVFLNPMVWERRLDEFYFRENGLPVDANGAYRLEGVPQGVYHAVALLPNGSGSFHFRAEAPGERELSRTVVEDSSEVRLDFRLSPPGRVRGRVVDGSGVAIPEARVSVSWGDFKPGPAGFFPISSIPGMKDSIHHTTQTDGEGHFEIEGLRLSYEPLGFRVRREGYVENEIELDVPAGAALETVVRLERLGATISGRLTDSEGEVIVGQTVGAFQTEGDRLGKFFQAKSAADGSYTLNLPEGARVHRVYPILRDKDPMLSEPERREGVPTGAHGIDFILVSKYTVRGRVLDERGDPVRDFVVHALERDPTSGQERWDSQREANLGEGRFELFVNPEKQRQIRFSAPGCDPASIGDLTNGEERLVRLLRAGDLFGVVLDQNGLGVPDAVVALATLDSAIYPKGTDFAPRATTDAEGRFRLEGVPEAEGGTLLLCPKRADAPPLLHYPLAELRGGPMELVLPECLEIELEFRNADGVPQEGNALVIDPEGWPLEPVFEAHLQDQEDSTRGLLVDGRTLYRLTPGAHHVVYIRDVDQQQAFPFEVVEGATGTRISFEVE